MQKKRLRNDVANPHGGSKGKGLAMTTVSI